MSCLELWPLKTTGPTRPQREHQRWLSCLELWPLKTTGPTRPRHRYRVQSYRRLQRSEDSSPASNEGSFEASRSASSSESPLAIARRTKRPIGMTKRFVLSQGRSPESFENQFRTGSSADGRAPRLSLNPSPLVIGGVEEAEECSSTGEAPEAGGGGAALFGGGGRRELFGSEGSSTAIQER